MSQRVCSLVYTLSPSRYSVLDYPTRLKSLEQYSLEKRRVVHDLVRTYKIIFMLVDVQTSKFFRLRNDVAPNYYKVLLNVSRLNVIIRRHFKQNVGLLLVFEIVCHLLLSIL